MNLVDCGLSCPRQRCAGLIRREWTNAEALHRAKAALMDFEDAMQRLSSERFDGAPLDESDWEWVRLGLK